MLTTCTRTAFHRFLMLALAVGGFIAGTRVVVEAMDTDDAAGSSALVSNAKSGSVDVIDPATFRIVSHFSVGSYPEHIKPSWNLRWLYVDNTYGNALTVVDPRTGRPTGRTIPVTDPYNLYFTPDGSKAIVVAERNRRLDFRDPRTWRLIKSVPIPAAGPDHLDFSAGARFLLVSAEFGGDVFRVSTTSMRVTGSLHVGGSPDMMQVSPDGRELWVSNRFDGTVSVIDTRTGHLIHVIPVGSSPHGLAFFPQPGRYSLGHNGVYR